MLNNMTVSSTVAFPARPPKTQKCWNELNDLLQEKDLGEMRPQNELVFWAKTNWPALGRLSWSPSSTAHRPKTSRQTRLDQG